MIHLPAKTKLGLILISVMLIFFAWKFISTHQSTLNKINRITPLEIPKHSTLISHEVSASNEWSMIFKLRSKDISKYWTKYSTHPTTYLDEGFAITDAILSGLGQEDQLDIHKKYQVRFGCQQATIFMSSMVEGDEYLYCWVSIPDWKTDPHCEDYGM